MPRTHLCQVNEEKFPRQQMFCNVHLDNCQETDVNLIWHWCLRNLCGLLDNCTNKLPFGPLGYFILQKIFLLTWRSFGPVPNSLGSLPLIEDSTKKTTVADNPKDTSQPCTLSQLMYPHYITSYWMSPRAIIARRDSEDQDEAVILHLIMSTRRNSLLMNRQLWHSTGLSTKPKIHSVAVTVEVISSQLNAVGLYRSSVAQPQIQL